MSKSVLIRTTGEMPGGGYPFLDPITGKHYRDLDATFDYRVLQIIRDRMANRRLVSNQKRLEKEYVAQELSEYVCGQAGLRNDPKFCSGAPAKQSFHPVAQSTPSGPCPKCGTEMTPVVCYTCGGKIVGAKCPACGFEP